MDPHMAEDEELQKLKEWWKKNGTSIIVGVVVGLVAILGFNGWNMYTANRGESASMLFTQLREAAQSGDAEQASQLAQELKEDFASTPYASGGVLVTAAALYSAGEIERARDLLQWALDNAPEPNLEHTARLRLAYLELGEGNHQKALDLATVADAGTYASQYAEIRADAHAAAGAAAEARTAYEEAIAAAGPGSGYVELLRAKLNDVAAAN